MTDAQLAAFGQLCNGEPRQPIVELAMTANRLHQLIEQRFSQNSQKRCLTDFDGAAFTGEQMLQAIHAAEQKLQGAQVRPGDRVMLVGENAVAMCAFVFACSRLDAWALPINARQSSAELQRIRQHAEPRAMVFASQVSTAADAHAQHFGAAETVRASFGEVRILPQLACQPEPCFRSASEQTAALFYTTGTTGEPKGVELSHNNLMFMARASGAVRGLNSNDLLYCCIPITHIYAFASGMLATLSQGAELWLASRFDPSDTFSALRQGVTCMPAVPAMYAHLMEHAERQGLVRLDAPKLRYIAAGGAPLDPDWKARVEQTFGLTLNNGYGMTEASPGIAVTRIGVEPADDACGPALPGTEVYLAPPPGKNTLDKGVGEVLVRGPHVMKGYYKNPKATAAALDTRGYLHTGDLGRWTAKGCLEIVGRCKELIIRSGFNVYPPEVESALNSHPQVTQCAVVGRPVKGNEQVLAFVQRAAGAELSSKVLQAWTKERLSPYKVPSLIIIADVLPCAPSGKPLKHLMIEHFKEALHAAECA
ncbi:MAG: class I adenylate-forming enzyme family protein [Granulosicoccaceae bacterium]